MQRTESFTRVFWISLGSLDVFCVFCRTDTAVPFFWARFLDKKLARLEPRIDFYRFLDFYSFLPLFRHFVIFSPQLFVLASGIHLWVDYTDFKALDLQNLDLKWWKLNILSRDCCLSDIRQIFWIFRLFRRILFNNAELWYVLRVC